MKNTFLSMLILMGVCLSCKKQTDEPMVEQTVFENLPSCCSFSVAQCQEDTKKAVFLNDIEGILLRTYYAADGITPIEHMIGADTLYKIKIPKADLPLFESCKHGLLICNIPKSLEKRDKPMLVRFSCKLYYFPFIENFQECGGYPAELTRIEILK